MPEFERWFRDDGDSTRLLKHDLNSDSVVFEVGGYLGNFTEKIHNKFDCRVCVFEPVKDFYTIINDKFKDNDKVSAFNCGLSGENTIVEMNIDKGNGENSTLFERDIIEDLETEKITLRRIDDIMVENNIKSIDLLNINIEGGEYDFLQYLVSSPVIYKVKNIQVQFHDFVEKAHTKRSILQAKLFNTHSPTYNYDFVWENWSLRA